MLALNNTKVGDELFAPGWTSYNNRTQVQTYDVTAGLQQGENAIFEQKDRVTEELQAFAQRDMIMLLKWLKYFVDTCSKKQIVWGIGRGSSVASYVLYLIGVHSVDSMKYNLDWQEFLR
jgi:DNA polymerase III alpha subunit